MQTQPTPVSLEHFPVMLRQARAKQGLRQQDMAERMGITQQAYQKLESPGANPTISTIMRLEKALGAELFKINF